MRDRDAEIGDLHRAVIFHQHVLRLDVPVDDMFFMGHGDRAGQLQHDVYRLIQVQCAALGDQLLERPSADIFHDDIMFSLAFPDIVDIHDIRVRELAGRARFPLKAQQRHRIIGKITAQDLDGHDPVQDGVHRLIHICHAALSDTFKELITISDQLIHRPHPPPSALPRP